MAPGLGARLGGFRRSLFSDRWDCEFRIGHGLWLTVAKDMERGNCAVLSILANELWLMGPACAGIGSAMWMARLESWLGLGEKTAGRYRIRAVCRCDLRLRILRSNR